MFRFASIWVFSSSTRQKESTLRMVIVSVTVFLPNWSSLISSFLVSSPSWSFSLQFPMTNPFSWMSDNLHLWSIFFAWFSEKKIPPRCLHFLQILLFFISSQSGNLFLRKNIDILGKDWHQTKSTHFTYHFCTIYWSLRLCWSQLRRE